MCDLNTAGVAELVSKLGVSIIEAYDLLLWRPYLDWEEIEMVPGFDCERVSRLKAGGATLVTPWRTLWRPSAGPADGVTQE